MEYSSIVHFGNKNYCFALEKGKFLIRLETKKDDMEKVILHYRDKYIRIEWQDTRVEVEMKKVRSDRFKDYYEVVIDLDVICARYFFILKDKEGKTSYFGNLDFYDEPITNQEYMFDCPQNLREEEAVVIPEWAKNKVIYQIFPSRFATDKKVSDSVWYQKPIGHNANLKGNLRGIINKLEYLKDLGIDIVYMTPIFKSSSSHKYNIEDYYQIDPDFGCEEDLRELVRKAHEMGMRVILDGVFNHSGDDFFAFKDVIKNGEKSEYRDWYYIKNFPLVRIWGKKPSYLTFGYGPMMPKLNLSNEKVQDYFIKVAQYWVEKCDIDGWRLDVGDEVSHFFWKKFRKNLKSVKKDVLIIGEIWHYAGDFLEGDEWDTVMNYQFYRSLLELVANESISPSKYIQGLNFMEGHHHPGTVSLLWNLMGSHDTERFLSICKGNVEKLKLAAGFMLLRKGMPMIYYGDEVGMDGGHDPDCRRGMYWDEKVQNQEVRDFYKRLIKIRHEELAITDWDDKIVSTIDEKNLLIEEIVKDGRKLILIFNCKGDAQNISNYEGSFDILGNCPFNGEIKGYGIVILEEKF